MNRKILGSIFLWPAKIRIVVKFFKNILTLTLYYDIIDITRN